jgi:hypothetical protein
MILIQICFGTRSIRSPGPVTPRDVESEGFNLTYTRIASDRSQKSSSQPPSSHSLDTDVDQKVDDAIESFLRTLSQIGPELLSVSCMYTVLECTLEM